MARIVFKKRIDPEKFQFIQVWDQIWHPQLCQVDMILIISSLDSQYSLIIVDEVGNNKSHTVRTHFWVQ